MPLDQLHRRIADDEIPESPLERLLQNGLAAVAPFYGAGAWTHRVLHDLGLRQRRMLPVPVFSVGNVTVGGTGKTPFTIWLTEWLREEGRRPAVLSRGYGRADEDALTIVHDGRRPRTTADEAGDEPLLIAESLGDVPVLACSDRYKAGRHALKRFAVDTLVLDDGLQHVMLGRQAEIILIDATRPPSRLRLFPRGTLREPLTVLGRAHLIVLTRCDQARGAKKLARKLAARHRSATVVSTRLVPRSLRNVRTGEKHTLEKIKGARVLVACGVANPDSVRKTVEKLGARVVRLRALPDHAEPSRREVERWETQRRKARADYIVVTEKDAVKLREHSNLPARILSLEVGMAFATPRDGAAAKKVLRARLHSRPVRGLLR
ncbi:MAG: tetraacyldisaccharide 4-kinase [Candidatus Sumerlaeota bacterium]|nr:tetraacyldisaccharide 4-kinase [Candidatus Sumerlaeota bacterium]